MTQRTIERLKMPQHNRSMCYWRLGPPARSPGPKRSLRPVTETYKLCTVKAAAVQKADSWALARALDVLDHSFDGRSEHNRLPHCLL